MIARLAGAAISDAPTLLGTPSNTTITVNPVTIPVNPGSQQVEYAISTSRNTPEDGYWQPGTTFINLTPGATYYVFARSAQNATHSAGTPHRSIGIRAVNHYTITFSANGADGTMATLSDMPAGTIIILPQSTFTPLPLPLIFTGWKANNEGPLLLAGANFQPSSTVTLYAQWNLIRGDADGNGKLEATDLTYLRRHLLGWANHPRSPAMDVNGDGFVNAADLTFLRRHLLMNPANTYGEPYYLRPLGS